MLMLRLVQKFPQVSWFIIGLVLFVPLLGQSHLFDWDEVNFAESAREMIVTGDFLGVQVNFKPFWEKPPLFIWLQAISFQFFDIFTEHAWVSMEFAARFPNAIIGAISLVVFYRVGKRMQDAGFGHWWAFSYLAAFTPHLYASTGIIDPLFNLFIFLGIYAFYRYSLDSSSWKNLIGSGVFIGLAMLTKGPVALLVWGLVFLIYGLLRRKYIADFGKKFGGFVLSGLMALSLFVAWYGLIAQKYGMQIITDFFAYQLRLLTTSEAGHGQPFYYHFVVLLIGCFPISIWAGARLFRWQGLKGMRNEAFDASGDFSLLMKILFWVVLILFSIVKTKIVHYSSLCWIPLAYVSAEVMQSFEKGNWNWSRVYSIVLLLVGTLFGLVLFLVPVVGQYSYAVAPLIKDVFVQGNLQAPVYWSGYEKYIGLFFIVALWYLVFDKKRSPIQKVFHVMFVGIGVLVAYVAVVVPKIEGYTQATVIDFYESKVGQKVYIEPLGFKSYAHLLYFQKPGGSPEAGELLESNSVDRPCYFVMKTNVEDSLKYHTRLRLLKEENGFLFYQKVK
jgi:4-amino-4-deoxy-L-arabinose transferase-like glycosyltransferase